MKSLVVGAAHWIEDDKVKHLKAEFENGAAQDASLVLSVTAIASILKAAPNKKKVVTDKVLEIAASSLNLDEAAKSKLLGRLRADPVLNKELGR